MGGSLSLASDQKIFQRQDSFFIFFVVTEATKHSLGFWLYCIQKLCIQALATAAKFGDSCFLEPYPNKTGKLTFQYRLVPGLCRRTCVQMTVLESSLQPHSPAYYKVIFFLSQPPPPRVTVYYCFICAEERVSFL